MRDLLIIGVMLIAFILGYLLICRVGDLIHRFRNRRR